MEVNVTTPRAEGSGGGGFGGGPPAGDATDAPTRLRPRGLAPKPHTRPRAGESGLLCERTTALSLLRWRLRAGAHRVLQHVRRDDGRAHRGHAGRLLQPDGAAGAVQEQVQEQVAERRAAGRRGGGGGGGGRGGGGARARAGAGGGGGGSGGGGGGGGGRSGRHSLPRRSIGNMSAPACVLGRHWRHSYSLEPPGERAHYAYCTQRGRSLPGSSLRFPGLGFGAGGERGDSPPADGDADGDDDADDLLEEEEDEDDDEVRRLQCATALPRPFPPPNP
ncbi:Protein of unknown function [Gryllus bimaculatus]|nr:Protein of unknown function [Gryllus bimaculatus]